MRCLSGIPWIRHGALDPDGIPGLSSVHGTLILNQVSLAWATSSLEPAESRRTLESRQAFAFLPEAGHRNTGSIMTLRPGRFLSIGLTALLILLAAGLVFIAAINIGDPLTVVTGIIQI